MALLNLINYSPSKRSNFYSPISVLDLVAKECGLLSSHTPRAIVLLWSRRDLRESGKQEIVDNRWWLGCASLMTVAHELGCGLGYCLVQSTPERRLYEATETKISAHKSADNWCVRKQDKRQGNEAAYQWRLQWDWTRRTDCYRDFMSRQWCLADSGAEQTVVLSRQWCWVDSGVE